MYKIASVALTAALGVAGVAQSVPAEARVAYAMAFREPKEWAGFYKSSTTSAKR